MKKIIGMCLSVLLILFLVGCSTEKDENKTSKDSEYRPDYSMLDLANTYNSLEEITQDSLLVVEAKLTGKVEEIHYGGADFLITNAKVTDVIVGESGYNNKEIKLFETKFYDIKRISKGDHFILFLRKYLGPVYEKEAFAVTGVYQGKYDIDKNNNVNYIAPDYNGITTFQSKSVPKSVEQFKEKIKSIPKEKKEK